MAETILLTGATGFVGRHFAEWLRKDGYDVIALTRRSEDLVENCHTLVVGPTLERDLRDIISRRDIKFVIHCAGRINGSAEDIERDNEALTKRLLDAVQPFANAFHFIYVSSVSAAGPLGLYGAAKRRCEDAIVNSELAHWLILRPSLLYGKYDTKNVAALVRWLKALPVIPVLGGKSVSLQPLYVEDLYAVIRRYLQNPIQNSVLTVAGPRQERLWDMIEEISKRLKSKSIRIPIPLRPLQIALPLISRALPFLNLPVQQISSLHNHPPWDSSAARGALAFAPRTFREGIAEMIAVCAE